MVPLVLLFRWKASSRLTRISRLRMRMKHPWLSPPPARSSTRRTSCFLLKHHCHVAPAYGTGCSNLCPAPAGRPPQATHRQPVCTLTPPCPPCLPGQPAHALGAAAAQMASGLVCITLGCQCSKGASPCPCSRQKTIGGDGVAHVL